MCLCDSISASPVRTLVLAQACQCNSKLSWDFWWQLHNRQKYAHRQNGTWCTHVEIDRVDIASSIRSPIVRVPRSCFVLGTNVMLPKVSKPCVLLFIQGAFAVKTFGWALQPASFYMHSTFSCTSDGHCLFEKAFAEKARVCQSKVKTRKFSYYWE